MYAGVCAGLLAGAANTRVCVWSVHVQVCSLVRPISRSKYPVLSETEEALSVPLQVPLAVYHRVSILQRCKPARSRACTLAHPCSASSLAIERVRAHTYSPHIGARQILFLAHIYTGLCTFSMHAHAHTADSVSHIYSLIGPHLHSPVHAHTCTRQILFLAIFDAIWLRILHRHACARAHTHKHHITQNTAQPRTR